MIIPINPVPAYPKEATQLSVQDGLVQLGAGADFLVQLLDVDGAPASTPTRVSLTDEQYSAWSSDDTEVAKAVAVNMGLTPA